MIIKHSQRIYEKLIVRIPPAEKRIGIEGILERINRS